MAPKEELTVEQMEELGVEDHNFPGYESFISLIKDMEAPTSLAAPENIICLPPSLSTLVGFRGLLLHRKYLITSAKQEYALPQLNQTRIVELDDSEARPGSSSQRDDTISPMETTSPMEMGDHSAKSTNGDSLEIEPSESPVPTLEPSSLGIDRPTTSNQDKDISVTAVDEELEQRHLNSIANHEKPENMAEIMPESTHQSEYLLEPDESMFDEAQNFFDGQSQISVEESGPEEELEDVELQFGNKEADALLLSRLLSLFYWPGIMSTVK